MFIEKGPVHLHAISNFLFCMHYSIYIYSIKRDKPGIRTKLLLISRMSLKPKEKGVFFHTSLSHIFTIQKSMKREDGKFSVEGVISFCRFAETMLPRKCRVSSVRRVAVKENFCCKIFAKLFIHSTLHAVRVEEEQAPWGSRIFNPGIFLGS